MKNDEKAIIAGVGAVLTYFYMENMEKNKKKEMNMSDVSIYPTEFYAK